MSHKQARRLTQPGRTIQTHRIGQQGLPVRVRPSAESKAPFPAGKNLVNIAVPAFVVEVFRHFIDEDQASFQFRLPPHPRVG